MKDSKILLERGLRNKRDYGKMNSGRREDGERETVD